MSVDKRSDGQKEIDRRVKSKVIQGMTLLRETFGDDWINQIDLDTLELADGTHCVLGQLYQPGPGVASFNAHYGRGVDVLNIRGKEADHGFLIDGNLAYEIDYAKFGYDFDSEEDSEETAYYEMLTDAWIEEILAKRGE